MGDKNEILASELDFRLDLSGISDINFNCKKVALRLFPGASKGFGSHYRDFVGELSFLEERSNSDISEILPII